MEENKDNVTLDEDLNLQDNEPQNNEDIEFDNKPSEGLDKDINNNPDKTETEDENEEEIDDEVDMDVIESQLASYVNGTSTEESQNKEEDTTDVEFDDNISLDAPSVTTKDGKFEVDIDTIQAQLKARMMQKNIEYDPNKSMEVMGENALIPAEDANLEANDAKNPNAVRIKDGEKKYVVYIKPENIEFMDSLTLKDRNVLINKILQEQDEVSKKRQELKNLKKFTNQVLIMAFTVIVSLPIFFVLLNKSIQVTILNYQQAQQNFVKLYREQGKIKSYKTFQKHFL